MSTAWRLTALVPVIVVLISAPAATQSFYGSLISVTQDAQGGVIPGATVVLTNTATNDRREGVTGADGAYRFVNLVPGTYRLEVELSGFQRYVRDQIVVNVQSTPRIEATLQLGSLQETVSVTGQAPLLQTENASVGTVVGSRAVQERVQSDRGRPDGRSAGLQRWQLDRQKRVCRRQLPDRRRSRQPERVVI
jgi:hypothetical protein